MFLQFKSKFAEIELGIIASPVKTLIKNITQHAHTHAQKPQ